MKNFEIQLEVLSNEELLAVRGGEAPTDPIIIKPESLSLSISIGTEKKNK